VGILKQKFKHPKAIRDFWAQQKREYRAKKKLEEGDKKK